MATKDKKTSDQQLDETPEIDLFEGMSPEEIAELLALTGQASNLSFDKTPTLKVNKYPIKDQQGNKVEMGNFVLGQRTKQEGKNTIVEDIGIDCGPNPEITVLKYGSKFSYVPESRDKKLMCQSNIGLDLGDKIVGDNLGYDCTSVKCPRRGKEVEKGEKCSAQFVVFVEVKVGDETHKAIMYFKGTSYIPFKTYVDGAGKFPIFWFPTRLETEQQINGTNVYWIVTPVLQKNRPFPLESRKALGLLVRDIDSGIREFEGKRKLLAASRKSEEQKALPPGMTVMAKEQGAASSSMGGIVSEDAQFTDIQF